VEQAQPAPRGPETAAAQNVAALRTAAPPVWYMTALHDGHGYQKKENRDVYQQATVLFFREQLLP
jgi:hypothetical protein